MRPRDQMTLPRLFSLSADNTLIIEPAPEVELLRFDHRSVAPTEIPENEEVALQEIGGKAMEIAEVIDLRDSREVGLCVFRGQDAAELTRISILRPEPKAWLCVNEPRHQLPPDRRLSRIFEERRLRPHG